MAKAPSKVPMAPGRSGDRVDQPPDGLVDVIKQRKCVLFIGAGLSQAAGFPDWNDLLQLLLAECVKGKHAPASRIDSIRSLIRSGESTKYLMAAEDIRECLGPDLFVSTLAKIFQDESKDPTAVHDELPKISFRSIITTNYDKLIECSYGKAHGGRVPPTFTCNDAPDIADAVFRDRFFILKAHGDVDKRSTLVLTEKDYREVFYRKPDYKAILSAIFTTQSVLFLGSSLGDPELWLLLGYLHDCFHGSGTHHYALVPRGDQSEAMFNRWKKDFQVQCIHYDPTTGHPEVLRFLKSLPHAT